MILTASNFLQQLICQRQYAAERLWLWSIMCLYNDRKNIKSLIFTEHNNLDRAGLRHYLLSEYKFPF